MSNDRGHKLREYRWNMFKWRTARRAQPDRDLASQQAADTVAERRHQENRQDAHRSWRISRSQARAARVTAIVTAVIGIATVVVTATNSGGSSVTMQGPLPPSAVNNDVNSLVVASAWPAITGCPAMGNVAMPPGMGSIDDFHAMTDIRPAMSASGAGSWDRGSMYLDLSGTSAQSIEIVNIQPHIISRDLAPPAWIYVPDDGCGPYDPNRIFKFNVDKPNWVDIGAFNGPGADPPGGMPTAPLGPAFTVSKAQHARIVVDVSACHGNYEWNLDIQYLPSGSSTIKDHIIGPFQSYGVANNTTEYAGHQDTTGKVHVDQTTTLTGSDSSNADDGSGALFDC